jgi:hypothetical protein
MGYFRNGMVVADIAGDGVRGLCGVRLNPQWFQWTPSFVEAQIDEKESRREE